MARGRKSAASLTVVRTLTGQRPEPPKELSAEQAETWRSVAATKPPEWFQPDSWPLLVAYCKHVSSFRVLSESVESFDPTWLANDEGLKRYEKLLQMRNRETTVINNLARAMRLTQQSRYKSETAARAHDKVGGAKKPWATTG